MLSFNKKLIVVIKNILICCFLCLDLFKYGFVSFDVLNDVGVFFLDVWVGYIYGFVFVVKLGVL